MFKYDRSDHLKKANWGYWDNGASNWVEPTSRFDLLNITYDDNGNLTHMKRRKYNAVGIDMYYNYLNNTNKLDYVSNLNGQGAGNYTYDANGNMIKDAAKLGSSNTILYDYRNLPVQVPTTSGTIDFSYDGNGNRLSKNGLFYVPGADGKVIAVYDQDGTHLYWNIWGLDLIGQRFWER